MVSGWHGQLPVSRRWFRRAVCLWPGAGAVGVGLWRGLRATSMEVIWGMWLHAAQDGSVGGDPVGLAFAQLFPILRTSPREGALVSRGHLIP